MKNIVLIGMPGAGKSTLGVLLAKAMGKLFVDTDIIIQQKTKRLLQDIIDNDGTDAFMKLEEEKAADVIEYLPPQLQVEILGDIDETLASRLISKLPHDEAADVLGEMEEDETQIYLNKLPKKFSSEIRELLTYNEDTAGGLMNPQVLTVTYSMTVKDALDNTDLDKILFHNIAGDWIQSPGILPFIGSFFM